MPVVVEGFKLPDFERNIGAFIRKVTIETAEKALRAEVAKGFDAQPVVVTDGITRRDYRNVRIGGRIEFIRRPQMADAMLWAFRELARISPRLSGRYVRSHIAMLNGREITDNNLALALRNVKDGDRGQIVNTQPYAKKIEGRTASKKRGIGGLRGQSRQAPGGVYRVVLRSLVQRYGRSMFFDMKYVKLSTGVKYVRRGKGKRSKAGRDVVYPAIQFFIKPTGLPK